jgi:hypothetical protein
MYTAEIVMGMTDRHHVAIQGSTACPMLACIPLFQPHAQ